MYPDYDTKQNKSFGPPPINFGPIAYWSRGFVFNRSRLLIGRELAQIPLAGNATASPRGIPQMLQQPA